jgi:hypothetical protein
MKTKNKLFTCLLFAALFATACNKEDETPNPFEGTGNHITSFVIKKGDVSYTAAVAAGTITVTVPENASLDGATATYELCENATIAPDPATITNWDSEQQFAVTAYNGTKTTYKYTVEHSGIVHNGAVVLKTQAEVDAFGQGDYTVVDGTIVIGVATGTDTITSLAPLAGLKVVSGGLVVNATYKGDLTAFEQLETVGELNVLSKKVKTVRFPKLTTVRTNMNVDQYSSSTGFVANNAIETLDFPELTIIERGLLIYYADALTTVNFPNLERVLGDIIVEARNQGQMLQLQSINFPNLTAVGGTIIFTRVAGLQSFSAEKLETAGGANLSGVALATVNLPVLKTVNGTLVVTLALEESTSLQLPALTTVETLQLSCQYLTSLSLPSLKKVGTFAAVDLRSLTSLDVRGIEDIDALTLGNNTLRYTAGITLKGNETFPGRLVLELPNLNPNAQNEFLLTVEGIKELGGLEHTPASAVVTIKAITFPWLERVTGLLSIGNSSQLASISLPNLQSVGSFSLGRLAALATLNLPRLETITGYTNASGAAAGGFTYLPSSTVTTAITLPELKSVVGDVSFAGLASTNNLATISFPELASLTGTLIITGTSNTKFTDLSGFSKLTSAAGITINGFTNLSDFSPLKKVVCSLPDAAAWNITNCGGTPANYSYETMKSTYCN